MLVAVQDDASFEMEELPVVHPPYLPQRQEESKSSEALDEVQKLERNWRYTLVLDLDETLIHYINNGESGDSVNENSESYFLIRPFCNEFLREMAQFYEIVIFTAGVQDYADWVVD